MALSFSDFEDYHGYTDHRERMDELAIQAAEIEAENAWLRHAERYDPEAQDDLAYHDFLFPTGYNGDYL